jgi:hypothetical protein
MLSLSHPIDRHGALSVARHFGKSTDNKNAHICFTTRGTDQQFLRCQGSGSMLASVKIRPAYRIPARGSRMRRFRGLKGIQSILAGILVLIFMDDGIVKAKWLSAQERQRNAYVRGVYGAEWFAGVECAEADSESAKQGQHQ